jgi:large conductance mechanosensitive channel protein
MLKGFREFILRGNVVDLAVGVVIGAAFNSVVESLVKNILTPLIGAIARVPDFSSLFFTFHLSRFFVRCVSKLVYIVRTRGGCGVLFCGGSGEHFVW